jgi:tRNA G18 (ribose-2'-O)-methylase SpoU
VIAPRDRAVGLNATAAKVASGAADTVPYITVTNLRALRELKDAGVDHRHGRRSVGHAVRHEARRPRGDV